ncbi:MAG: zinc-binding dehydrogenase [Oscillospiraceae bacterium]|jgi:threonine dehydrogenase-like Zn-dependent dehydrogenase|nr:zinc-binding dehydrogenase [Oscillospiraceae bacterium]
MTTTAVRLYGKDDLRLETFALPPIRDDEILAKVVSDSICMSTYKAAKQGAAHKRVPDDVADNPVIVGHEFCGELVEIGSKWAATGCCESRSAPDRRHFFHPGDKFAIQPAVNDPADIYAAPGYSFPYIGGAATYIIIPSVFMERGCLLPYNGNAFYHGSLAEPMSCIVGGFHCMYHAKAGNYVHEMGIKSGGKMALLAGAGPMGLGAIDYALHCTRRPSLLVVTDIDEDRLVRAKNLFPPEHAKECGVELIYCSAPDTAALTELSGGTGYDDVFVYAPVAPLVEQGSAILGHDGCLNFFAGPTDPSFSAKLNFYNMHYSNHHTACNSGGNTDDMRESLDMMAAGTIDPSAMVTHVGGLDAVIDATLNLPGLPGGKKLIYTHISMPLTEIEGLWTPEREKVLLETGKLL